MHYFEACLCKLCSSEAPQRRLRDRREGLRPVETRVEGPHVEVATFDEDERLSNCCVCYVCRKLHTPD